MTTVKQVLRSKSEGAFGISPQAMVYEALQLMADKDIGALVVMENEQVAGIFSSGITRARASCAAGRPKKLQWPN